MYIIGITGGTGAGKTSALRVLESMGALAVDCDAVYHEILASDGNMKMELEDRFPGVLVDGVIDRRALGGIVFNDPDALSDLNTITHKYTTDAVEERLEKWEAQGGSIAAIDAIALIESGINAKCDIVVGVTASRETRLLRIMQRDGISREQAETRINAQKPDSFFEEHCDYILENNYTNVEDFDKYCIEFFSKII
ncbi:MAG: dephospho-CoA kinase [Oscillospiraceae bacterium]|nr:dephospho-CoA kinase [Oscillospiraceae bacterium]